MQGFDPLWVPVLTHYSENAARLDGQRVAAHLASITPHVRQYLVAGTTGDGWGMKDAVFADWLDFCASSEVLGENHTILVGAFGKTTDEVVAQARKIETHFNERPSKARFAGLTVCAPVDENATQDAISRHFEAILGATSSPLAIYQLPQVTGNLIAPETFKKLAENNPRITLFKDTSGEDAVTKADAVPKSVKALRGMEGDYAAHLEPQGAYDGWLLSTANGFATQLRKIADLTQGGDFAAAAALSDRLAGLVKLLFERAASLPSGNPFSNANRAVDHIRAHGGEWRKTKAILADGSYLPEDFLAFTEDALNEAGFGSHEGYLA